MDQLLLPLLLRHAYVSDCCIWPLLASAPRMLHDFPRLCRTHDGITTQRDMIWSDYVVLTPRGAWNLKFMSAWHLHSALHQFLCTVHSCMPAERTHERVDAVLTVYVIVYKHSLHTVSTRAPSGTRKQSPTKRAKLLQWCRLQLRCKVQRAGKDLIQILHV